MPRKIMARSIFMKMTFMISAGTPISPSISVKTYGAESMRSNSNARATRISSRCLFYLSGEKGKRTSVFLSPPSPTRFMATMPDPISRTLGRSVSGIGMPIPTTPRISAITDFPPTISIVTTAESAMHLLKDR